MSKGWESKSVEAQQAEQESASTAGSASASKAQPGRVGNINADAEQARRLQALHLQRERILSERTSSPHRRTALSTALASVEEELAQLGWTLHL